MRMGRIRSNGMTIYRVAPECRTTKSFVSYSHKDNRWCAELETHLKPYRRKGTLTSWLDRQDSPRFTIVQRDSIPVSEQ
jgi:hypothetical protein